MLSSSSSSDESSSVLPPDKLEPFFSFLFLLSPSSSSLGSGSSPFTLLRPGWLLMTPLLAGKDLELGLAFPFEDLLVELPVFEPSLLLDSAWEMILSCVRAIPLFAPSSLPLLDSRQVVPMAAMARTARMIRMLDLVKTLLLLCSCGSIISTQSCSILACSCPTGPISTVSSSLSIIFDYSAGIKQHQFKGEGGQQTT